MDSDRHHVVQQGDCLFSLAAQYGFHWKTIWEHAQNAELRQRRSDPGLLHPGDVVSIPLKETRSASCPTEARHKFRVQNFQCEVRIRLFMFGIPRSAVRWALVVDGQRFEGKTDSDGYLKQGISAKASRADLIIYDDDVEEHYLLQLGHQDPVEEWSGIQKRLVNLGYGCDISGREDEQTLAGLEAFRKQAQVEGTTQEVIMRLKEMYGS